MGKDMEGNGYELIWGTNPESAWRNWGKPWNTSIRLPGLQAGILIQDLHQWSRSDKQSIAPYVTTVHTICQCYKCGINPAVYSV